MKERERMVTQDIQARIAVLESIQGKSLKQEIELRSLRLRNLQKRVRDHINEEVTWEEISTGCFLGTKVMFIAQF